MNLLQTEDLIKGMPDDYLMKEAKAPTGQVPQFLVVSEIQRRSDMRKRFSAEKEQPQGTVAEQIIRGADQRPPPAQMPRQLPTGPGIFPNPDVRLPPPQNPNAEIAPAGGYAGGGIVRMQEGGMTNPYANAYNYRDIAYEAGRRTGINPAIIMGMLEKESGFNPNSVSPAGAGGIMQIMEATGNKPGYGVQPIAAEDRFDPEKAINWGADYLAALRDSLGGMDSAITAYHSGPGNVQSGQLGPVGSTYAEDVMRRAQQYQDAFNMPVGPVTADRPDINAPTLPERSLGPNPLESVMGNVDTGYFNPNFTEYTRTNVNLGSEPQRKYDADNRVAREQPDIDVSGIRAFGPAPGEPDVGLVDVGLNGEYSKDPQVQGRSRAQVQGTGSFLDSLASLSLGNIIKSADDEYLGGMGFGDGTEEDVEPRKNRWKVYGEEKPVNPARQGPHEPKKYYPPAPEGYVREPKSDPGEPGVDADLKGIMALNGGDEWAKLLGKSVSAPDFSKEIERQRKAAYANALVELGTGIATGNMPQGIQRATYAAQAANRDADKMSMQQAMMKYADERETLKQDVDILYKSGSLNVQTARMILDSKIQDRRDKNVNKTLVQTMIRELMDTYQDDPEQARPIIISIAKEYLSPEEAKAWEEAFKGLGKSSTLDMSKYEKGKT